MKLPFVITYPRDLIDPDQSRRPSQGSQEGDSSNSSLLTHETTIPLLHDHTGSLSKVSVLCVQVRKQFTQEKENYRFSPS